MTIWVEYSFCFEFVIMYLEDLEPIGASPLTAAFLLALGGLYEGSGKEYTGRYIMCSDEEFKFFFKGS